MGKHVPLPSDPVARSIEQKRRRAAYMKERYRTGAYIPARKKFPGKYKENDRVRQQRRRSKIRSFVGDLKKSGCVDCGFYHPAVLQFHHMNPADKLGSVQNLIAGGHSEQVVRAEIGKCVVLCANCHAIRHWTERQ